MHATRDDCDTSRKSSRIEAGEHQVRDAGDENARNEGAGRRHLGQLGSDVLHSWVSRADRQAEIRVEEMMRREDVEE